MFPWPHIGTALTASYLASFVEFVEALTVVLAVGISRGWRFALAGTAAALVLLAAIVGLAGGSAAKIPLPLVRVAVGTLALLFGLRWLRKAILRSAGAIALHDEAAEFAKVSLRLRAAGPGRGSWDAVAFAASFKIVMLEGIEVVFIVVALGANGHRWWPAISGALAAFITVVLLGVALHRPLARIPENALKFAVGVILTAFGTFWVGEGLALAWPGGDAMIGVLIAAYWSTAAMLAASCRKRLAAAVPAARSNGAAPPAGGSPHRLAPRHDVVRRRPRTRSGRRRDHSAGPARRAPCAHARIPARRDLLPGDCAAARMERAARGRQAPQ